jgi:S1-C subfamily serine protease
MNINVIAKPLVISALSAAVGASAMLAFVGQRNAGIGPTIAVATGEDDQQRIIAAVKHVEPSVVALDVDINGTRVVPTDPFAGMFGSTDGGGGQLMPFHERASGSGFVFSRSGLILTNDHVVHGASKIEVVFANGDRVKGHIYSENAAGDLALVKVDDYAKLPPPVDFGSSRDVQQGEWAIAIGEPYALKQTVTVGVVSGFNRNETIGDGNGSPHVFNGLLQTSAPINPGNSGGPLIDMDGRVIGVNQSVERPAQDIGFAIPVDSVKRMVAVLATHRGPATIAGSGFLGVQLAPLDGNLRTQLNYQGQGAAVVSVVSGSPADQAGIAPGDVIQRIDGTAVHTPADVTAAVHALAPGRAATLTVWSAGTRELVGVHVAAQPDQTD